MPVKFLADGAADADLDWLADVDVVNICEAMPASFAEATTAKGSGGKKLGSSSPGTMTKADGDTSGRKLTMGAISNAPISVTGVADYAAGTKSSGSVLKWVLPLSNAPIVGVNQGAKQITVTGDVSAICTAGKVITVRGSSGNDGIYTVSSSTYSNPNTTITVQEAIPSATADGIVVHGAASVNGGGTVSLTALKIDEVRDPQ